MMHDHVYHLQPVKAIQFHRIVALASKI
ncbi:hypothetical protein LINGRAHAP2_LOCUS21810 [Linum grandiflorum]